METKFKIQTFAWQNVIIVSVIKLAFAVSEEEKKVDGDELCGVHAQTMKQRSCVETVFLELPW